MRNASRNGRPEPVELEALHQGGRVAKALDTPVVSFFLDELSERIFVTRADQRRRVVRLRYDLEEGDTIYYPATLPHRWENPARKRARFLGVCTPPGY